MRCAPHHIVSRIINVPTVVNLVGGTRYWNVLADQIAVFDNFLQIELYMDQKRLVNLFSRHSRRMKKGSAVELLPHPKYEGGPKDTI